MSLADIFARSLTLHLMFTHDPRYKSEKWVKGKWFDVAAPLQKMAEAAGGGPSAPHRAEGYPLYAGLHRPLPWRAKGGSIVQPPLAEAMPKVGPHVRSPAAALL